MTIEYRGKYKTHVKMTSCPFCGYEFKNDKNHVGNSRVAHLRKCPETGVGGLP